MTQLPSQMMATIYRNSRRYLAQSSIVHELTSWMGLLAKIELAGVPVDWAALEQTEELYLPMHEAFQFQLQWTIEISKILFACSPAERQKLRVPTPAYSLEDISRFVADCKVLIGQRRWLSRFHASKQMVLKPKKIEICSQFLGTEKVADSVFKSLDEIKLRLFNQWLKEGLEQRDQVLLDAINTLLGDDVFFWVNDDNLRRLYRFFEVVDGVPCWLLDTPRIEKRKEGQLKLQALCEVAVDSPERLEKLHTLTFEHFDLHELPPRIGQLSSLRKLQLQHNQLESLPSSFAQLVNLRHIDISHNRFVQLPEVWTNLVHVQYVNIEENHLVRLPSSMGYLANLQRLQVKGNYLPELPNSFMHLQSLTYLDLRNNKFRICPSLLGKLSALREVFLSNNRLRALDESIGELALLEVLEVADNNLLTLPDSLASLSHLKCLDVSNNGLQAFAFTAGLRSLRELYLGRNFVGLLEDQELDQFFVQLAQTQIQTLDLSHNKIRHLPYRIGELRSLCKLYLSGNGLRDLPDLSQLTSLYHVDISENRIGDWSAIAQERLFFQLCNYSCLRKLDLSGNRFRSIPSCFSSLQHLHSLSMQGNDIGDWPLDYQQNFFDALEHLRNVKVLNLSANRLHSIPSSWGQRFMLHRLNLSGNRLRVLPDSVSTMVELVSLNVRDNRLVTIPSLEAMQKLQVLDLSGNELTSFPVLCTVASQLKWLSMRRNNCCNIPKSIGGLQALRELDIGSNLLEKLPNSIKLLTELRVLQVADNQLLAFEQLESLKKLTYLDFRGNNLGRWNEANISSFLLALGHLSELRFLGIDSNPLTHEQRLLLHRQLPNRGAFREKH